MRMNNENGFGYGERRIQSSQESMRALKNRKGVGHDVGGIVTDSRGDSYHVDDTIEAGFCQSTIPGTEAFHA